MKKYNTLNEEIDNIKRLFSYKKGTLSNEEESINEQLGLTAAILAYRQTAISKSDRLTRKIRNTLKDMGLLKLIKSEGNFRKFMSCINSSVDAAGERIAGIKKVNKDLVRNADMITTFKDKEKSKADLDNFRKEFEKNISYCGKEFNITDEDMSTIVDVMVRVIEEFQQKTFHL